MSAISGLGAWAILVYGTGAAWAQSEDKPQMLPGGDFTGSIVEMLFSLGLVLAVMLAILWAVRKLMPGMAGMGGGMRLLGRLSLGPRRFVALVEVAGEVLVLGVGGDGIRLLYKVEDPQALEEIRSVPQPAFKNILNKVRKKDEELS